MQQEVSAALSRVMLVIKTMCSSQAFLRNVDGQIVSQSRMQAMFNIRFKDLLDQRLYESILSYMIDAEKMAPGGFVACVQGLLGCFGTSEGMTTEHANTSASMTVSGARNKACRRADIDAHVVASLSVHGQLFVELMQQALELGGFRSTMIVEPTLAHEPSLELVSGYTFELKPAFGINGIPLDIRCVCIDGYVETVSEIHHLLSEASETHDWIVIFLRGMADDVKHTLKVNHDRCTLNVIPVVVDFDLTGINTLNDLATVTGCDLISSNKGDLISSIRLSSLPKIDRLGFHNNRMIIRNVSTKAVVQQHLKTLRLKRLGENVDDIARLLDIRIRTLSSDHLIIRLPHDRTFVVVSQAFDYALRNLRCIIEYGLLGEGYDVKPALTTLASNMYVTRCMSMIESLGCVVMPQDSSVLQGHQVHQ